MTGKARVSVRRPRDTRAGSAKVPRSGVLAVSRSRIVIVGAGFAGYQAARMLSRTLRGAAEIVLVNPNDYFLYLPLLPEVAAGVLEPRRVSVSLAGTLRGVRLVLGEVDGVDLPTRKITYVDPEGQAGELRYDRLVLTVGSVNKLLPIPGVAEHAHGSSSRHAIESAPKTDLKDR